MRKIGFRILFLFVTSTAFCQEYVISGEVLSEITKEPVVGATIFFDGTSIGTITDVDGKFVLKTEKKFNAPLIIRSLGYESISLPKLDTSFFRVLLKEAPVALEGITLEPDAWPRAKKLMVFKREFLGVKNKRCKIVNESDLRLYYNNSKKILYAFADKPLEVDNQKLGYKITYYLEDFQAVLHKRSVDKDDVKEVLYVGFMQFEDKYKKVLRTVKKRRKKTYFGSKLHFLRAFYSNRLRKEDFQFYTKGRISSFSSLFSVKTVEDILFVYPEEKQVGVLYDGIEQSFVQFETDEFIIDSYGNHSPPDKLLFGGEMGKSRVGDMLPINYEVK
ncbi:carboxypeptidase-like regulatory domain-containing protein [Croceitalea marina]|uniref:Carboxypeptidase-like regulatory domain-containing protein n=1 Tax=Croceitalea marina TaxID=1775166 RepID=A0ABW5N116_9FLAO